MSRRARARILSALAAVALGSSLALLPATAIGATPAWASSVPFTNRVVSSPTVGGGFPDPSGSPVPGTCARGSFDANHSESWLAVQPGTETIVGSSKFFFDRYSTFYNFYLGSYAIGRGGASNDIVQGYDCTTTGTQAMPPTWTNVTDPNVDFDTKGRAYMTTLPFNAYWTNLHPNGAIDVSYSDDLGGHWVKGNGGQDLEKSPDESSFSLKFEDKQWIAVNHIPGNAYQDHVYAMWTMFKGAAGEIRVAVSRDRGQTFSPEARVSLPQSVGPKNTYVYPAIDAAGTVYASFVAFPSNGPATIYVTRSTDDGQTWTQFSRVATTGYLTTCCLPNTTFRDGITESFAASPTYPGHLYLAWEDWDGRQMDVKFSQSTDGGATWSPPAVVNDNVDAAGVPTDQFQPEVAAGPGGAVAVGFYDRRQACPADPSVLPADVGRRDWCIDTSLQAYRDSGAGAAAVDRNVRISSYSWDPQNPAQTLGGIGQMACSGVDDPCTESFIGDYFGLAISGGNVYALMVSTHYASDVRADCGGPIYYQQQVLATVPRAALGL